MERKLIFLDIDGTLTEPGKNAPPDSAVEAVHAARANGHRVVLCSGRNRGMLSPLLRYGFDGLVGSAGGYIEYAGEVVYDCPMTPEQQALALDVFQRSGVYRTVEGRDSSYTDEAFKEFLREAAQAEGNSELLRWREQIECELGIRPMAEYRGEPVYKMGFVSRSADGLREPMQALGDSFDFCIQGTDQFGAINGDVTALTLSGLSTRRFSFEAFLPHDKKERRAVLEALQTETHTIILYEAPHHLKSTLAELYDSLGERKITLCRELTKIHETIEQFTLSTAINHFEYTEPRGEYVLVIEGVSIEELNAREQAKWESLSIPEHLELYLAKGLNKKDAMKEVAKDRGVPKREIYQQLLHHQENKEL